MQDPTVAELVAEFQRTRAYVEEFAPTDEQYEDAVCDAAHALAALRERTPDLATEIEHLQTQVNALREALQFYAAEWKSYAFGMVATEALVNDEGDKARAALNRITPEWCVEMAKLELGHEVGAGTLAIDPVPDECPHAAPFKYCQVCKVSPCPIGLKTVGSMG